MSTLRAFECYYFKIIINWWHSPFKKCPYKVKIILAHFLLCLRMFSLTALRQKIYEKQLPANRKSGDLLRPLYFRRYQTFSVYFLEVSAFRKIIKNQKMQQENFVFGPLPQDSMLFCQACTSPYVPLPSAPLLNSSQDALLFPPFSY
jgi:hypothetical protein